MKPVPTSSRVVGELSPVTLGSYGVVNRVSVLVSVADPASPMSLLQRQLRLEARVGIGRGSFTVPSLTHSVSRLILALFCRGSNYFFDCFSNATYCPVTASKMLVR